jgi:hypothetical protein
MKWLLVVCVCFIAASHSAVLNIDIEAIEWETYKADYNKQYESLEEEQRRRGIWEANRKVCISWCFCLYAKKLCILVKKFWVKLISLFMPLAFNLLSQLCFRIST